MLSEQLAARPQATSSDISIFGEWGKIYGGGTAKDLDEADSGVRLNM